MIDTKKVIITGATGLIGKKLIPLIEAAGYDAFILSRKQTKDPRYILWDHHKGFIEEAKLQNTYAVLHLAGSGIADGRWTTERRKEIISSRVDTADLLYKTFKKLNIHPKVFISSSGTGHYGADSGSALMNESSPGTSDFISVVCQKWEQAANQFIDLNSRVVILRTGVVLSADGGALPKLSQTIRYGVGSAIASGSQYMSWIHIDDLCRLYVESLKNEQFIGIYNAVADETLTNSDFTRTIAKTLGKPLFMPNVPSFVLKLLFGEMASLLIGGNNVSNTKLKEVGFLCHYPKLHMALGHLFNKQSQ
jgi:uncharacterized protein